MTGKRKKYIAFSLMILFVTASIAVLSLYYPEGSTRSITTSIKAVTETSSRSILSNNPNGQPYLNVSKPYDSLGYPKITYDNYDTPYLPSEANFTLEYRTKNAGFHVGSIQAPAISLNEAVELAAAYAKLDPTNYTLGEAVFTPGTVFNSTLIAYPEWFLCFARNYDGYWLYDNYGPQALSVEVYVDALNGTVRHVEGDTLLLSSSGQHELNVNSSRALETVRSSSLPGVPPALTENGTVSFIEPRMVIPRLSPNTSWLDASLFGQNRLLWIIKLGYSNFGGVFAVDAGTGALVTGSAGAGISHPPGGYESGSLAFSTAKNLAVSEQTFLIDGSIVGRSGSVPVAVPNVLNVKPGSTASIQLNYTTFNIGSPPNVTLSFANPLPGLQNSSSDGSPPGVLFQFSRPTFALHPGNGSAYATLLISVDRNVPSGTYLIEVDATYFRPDLAQPGTIQVLFFLSAWNGAGQWPPPPVIK